MKTEYRILEGKKEDIEKLLNLYYENFNIVFPAGMTLKNNDEIIILIQITEFN